MPLHPTLRTISRNLPSVARSLGFQARVTSGYRSRATQTRLYKKFIQGLHPYPVAPPGTSDHEVGLALDVVSTDTQKLVSLLASVGLSWGGQADPVHFSMIARRSEATAKSGAFKSYEADVGSSIPGFLTQLPVVGRWFGILRNPKAQATEDFMTLITAVLGPL